MIDAVVSTRWLGGGADQGNGSRIRGADAGEKRMKPNRAVDIWARLARALARQTLWQALKVALELTETFRVQASALPAFSHSGEFSGKPFSVQTHD